MIFPHPKQALDDAWYSIDFGEALIGLVGPVDVGVVHLTYTPPVVAPPLVAADTQLTADAAGRANYSVACHISGGLPGAAYLLTASALTVAGGRRYVSAVLQVQ